MRAWNLTRRDIVYRHDSFSAGLRAAGYDVQKGAPTDAKPGDLVLSWNRYGANHDICTRFDAAGGVVLVAENGYIGPGGISPHGQKYRQWYALARGWHNDAGAVRMGSGDRWDALGVPLAPWRADGGHILVCPNRSFGVPGRMMPPGWGELTADRLKKLTKRPIRLRAHPGNDPPRKPLVDDLAGAWACVIWSSSAGVHALVAGVPVFCEAPAWICKGAAGALSQVDAPPMPDRLPAMQRLAWGQWSLSELESGAAFRHLLHPAGQGEISAGA